MATINKLSTQNIVLDNVLQYDAQLKKKIKYTSNPESATQRKAHLIKRQTRLEKQLAQVKIKQSMIPAIPTLKKGILKSNARIKELKNLETLKNQASKITNIFYKFILNIAISLKEACLGYSTKDLPQLKVNNQKLKNTLSQLKKATRTELSERQEHLGHLIRVAKSEKNQIDRLTIPTGTALESAEHQIGKDIARNYTYTINDQTYNDKDAVISKLREISDDGIGRLVLFELSNQTLPILLKNIVQDQINALYHQTPENAQYIIQDISDSKNIHISEKNGIIHIDLTVKHSVQNPNKEEHYQMDSSIHLELDKSGNIVRAILNVVPTS
jgi:hypothetical protein